jgi:hypothetical protein
MMWVLKEAQQSSNLYTFQEIHVVLTTFLHMLQQFHSQYVERPALPFVWANALAVIN